jgi:integrase
MLRKLMKRIRDVSGLKRGEGSLKTYRATFGQTAKDAGAQIDSISRAMRHRTTMTTERYYARVRPNAAFEDIRRAVDGGVAISDGRPPRPAPGA